MSKFNPIIVVNVNPGSKGHQIGRLISTCDNILWYDHETNGTHPWEPCSNILNSEISRFHYERRFADNTTVIPVLDYARRIGLPDTPELSYDRCQDGDNLLYVIHSKLDESRDYFKGQHVVVLNNDPERFFRTTWNFRGGKGHGKNKKLVSDMFTKEEVVTGLTENVNNYRNNINSDDFVIDSADELFDMDNFKSMCEKFGLIFNEQAYKRTIKFLRS